MAARNPFASSVPDIFDPYALVQTRRPAHSTAYYFVRNLLLVGAIAGGIVAAYRNDVFRDLARRIGQEPRYLEAETFLVGTPGWGTPRSMESVLNPENHPPTADSRAASAAQSGDNRASTGTAPVETTAAAAPSPTEDRTPAPPTETAPHVVATTLAPTTPAAASPAAASPAVATPPPAAAPATTALVATRTATSTNSLAPVSFDSLPVVTKGAAPRATAAAQPPPARPAAPAPVAHAPAPRPAPVDHSHAKAIKVSLDETPEPASHRTVPLPTRAAPPPPEPRPAPPPAPAKPERPQSKPSDVHEGDNPLLAAVRGAVRTHPAKSSVPAAQ
jgi:hypothetical protein